MAAPKNFSNLSLEDARAWLAYDPRTGKITWKLTRGPRAQEGQEAGCVRSTDGAVVVSIKGEIWMAHRLAWFLYKGQLPPARLLFRDGDRTNLRWSNLLLESETYSTTPNATRTRESRRQRRSRLRHDDHIDRHRS